MLSTTPAGTRFFQICFVWSCAHVLLEKKKKCDSTAHWCVLLKEKMPNRGLNTENDSGWIWKNDVSYPSQGKQDPREHSAPLCKFVYRTAPRVAAFFFSSFCEYEKSGAKRAREGGETLVFIYHTRFNYSSASNGFYLESWRVQWPMLLTAPRAGGSVSEKGGQQSTEGGGRLGGYHRAPSVETNLLNERRNIWVCLQTNFLLAYGHISAEDFSVGLQRRRWGCECAQNTQKSHSEQDPVLFSVKIYIKMSFKGTTTSVLWTQIQETGEKTEIRYKEELLVINCPDKNCSPYFPH